MPRPGWLMRQLEVASRDYEQLPDWMKRLEMGDRAEFEVDYRKLWIGLSSWLALRQQQYGPAVSCEDVLSEMDEMQYRAWACGKYPQK